MNHLYSIRIRNICAQKKPLTRHHLTGIRRLHKGSTDRASLPEIQSTYLVHVILIDGTNDFIFTIRNRSKHPMRTGPIFDSQVSTKYVCVIFNKPNL